LEFYKARAEKTTKRVNTLSIRGFEHFSKGFDLVGGALLLNQQYYEEVAEARQNIIKVWGLAALEELEAAELTPRQAKLSELWKEQAAFWENELQKLKTNLENTLGLADIKKNPFRKNKKDDPFQPINDRSERKSN
jgi:hypothetical protein